MRIRSPEHYKQTAAMLRKEETSEKGLSMTKSAIVDLMIAKAQTAEQSPGNPANEQGPVHGSAHGGKAPARTSVPYDGDEQSPGNPSNEQESVSGYAHAGKGPEQTKVSGSAHGGKAPARTSVPYDGDEQFAGNPTQVNKAAALFDHDTIHAERVKPHFDAAHEHMQAARTAADSQGHDLHDKAAHAHMSASMDHYLASKKGDPAARQKAWNSSQKANSLSERADRVTSQHATSAASGKAALSSLGYAPHSEKDVSKAHAGKDSVQMEVEGEAHAGKGRGKKDVKGTISGGNPEEVSKAVKASSVPRMPRAMAMSMDTWRSATSVLTRGNCEVSKHFTHHGAGPLFPETAQEIDDEAQMRATRSPEVFKSCEACGRTYRITKSMDEPCPTCAGNNNSCMTKSRGGYMVPSFIKD